VAEEMHGEFVGALRTLFPNAATFPEPPAPPAPRPGEVEARAAAVEAAAAAGNYASVMPKNNKTAAGDAEVLATAAAAGDEEVLAGFAPPLGPDAWSTRVSLKCSKEDALDGADAARGKAARYREDNAAEMSPLTTYSSFIVDCLRATVVCADSESMVHACEALTRPKSPFEEVKFRNNLGALRKPYNLVFNAVFKPLFMPPLMVEISLIHHDVHQLVQMAERFEKISTVWLYSFVFFSLPRNFSLRTS
jgi:hypothetical protein